MRRLGETAGSGEGEVDDDDVGDAHASSVIAVCVRTCFAA